ncbi:hypothetical protein F2Q69_00002041 [Brassica cretica]|uniref:Uncharacterized protein n=1 Tax=Brassica cretica TaxID=69181 RepID=A0A8S9NRB6_BRACR|nr:hypothetical protein F2Q69_00002041 [Brassica cretica]
MLMVLLFKLLKRAFGLVDLCSTAFSNRASSPGARDICFAAFRNVLTFFVQVPDDFFPRLMQKLSDGDSLPLIKLSHNEPEPDENSGQTGSNKTEAIGKNAEGLSGCSFDYAEHT